MNTFNITIKFDLRDDNMSMDNIDDLLFENGFDDAFVSHSGTGQIEIEISRNAETKDILTESIIRQVTSLFPNSKFLN
ncbi:hypothetical protein NO989_00230 [Alteromonas sp. DY56-G5]|jgi:hypothetical protein|uniref:hypothetical protein n=1 Tax=unclassified Alteromonas TaxID=2614992 RepID=UPI000EE19E89|nr:hypothetical protein [Gammaproteobacteria bacterium]|tara:strand:- start:247 stop:480 length:234 start_codon:yes stop_codon:yes gene_type:complete